MSEKAAAAMAIYEDLIGQEEGVGEWLEVDQCFNIEENGDVDSENDRLSTVGEGGESGASVVTDDPMSQVAADEVVEDAPVVANQPLRRARSFRGSVKSKIINVTLPERAPATGIDEGTRNVRIYCETKRKLWLCLDDADWALLYLKDQLETKGVHRVDAGDVGPGGVLDAPCEADQPRPLALRDYPQSVGEATPAQSHATHTASPG